MEKTLNLLKPGQRGTIIRVDGIGPVKRRLVDMGITPDIEVWVRRIAPLGDPMEVVIRGFDLALRKEDAARITVETEQ